MIYKFTALTTFQFKKVYLGLAEGEFKKQRYHNHTQSRCNDIYSNSATLFSYVWTIKKTKKETPSLVWGIIRPATLCTNKTKRCSLCLHEKLAILMYQNQSELLNKKQKLVSKCRHVNKFLIQTFNSNDLRKYLYSLMSSNQLK